MHPSFPAGRHQLHCGDCLSVLPTMEAHSVDIVVTSPALQYRPPLRRLRRPARRGGVSRLADGGRGRAPPRAAAGRIVLPQRVRLGHPALAAVRARGPAPAVLPPPEPYHLGQVDHHGRGDDRHFKPIGGERFLHQNHEHLFHFTGSGRVKLDRLAIGVPFQDKSISGVAVTRRISAAGATPGSFPTGPCRAGRRSSTPSGHVPDRAAALVRPAARGERSRGARPVRGGRARRWSQPSSSAGAASGSSSTRPMSRSRARGSPTRCVPSARICCVRRCSPR